MTVLNATEGEARKARAMDQLEEAHPTWIELARKTAIYIARTTDGTVTADEVREHLYPEHRPPHPNAWGAVFNCRAFVSTGEFIRSAAPSRHRSVQRVWRLADC
jgi:hypothetical protein